MIHKLRTKQNRGTKQGTVMINTGVLLIIGSLIVMITIFRVTFGTIFVACLGLIAVTGGLLKRFKELKRYERIVNIAQKTLTTLLILWLISFAIIQGLIVSSLSTSTDPEVEVNYAVVLGAGLEEDEPSLTLSTRLLKSMEYLENHPDAKIIVSGGTGAGQAISEAEVMERFLVEKGIDRQRIIKEEKATNTRENIIFTKNITSVALIRSDL